MTVRRSRPGSAAEAFAVAALVAATLVACSGPTTTVSSDRHPAGTSSRATSHPTPGHAGSAATNRPAAAAPFQNHVVSGVSGFDNVATISSDRTMVTGQVYLTDGHFDAVLDSHGEPLPLPQLDLARDSDTTFMFAGSALLALGVQGQASGLSDPVQQLERLDPATGKALWSTTDVPKDVKGHFGWWVPVAGDVAVFGKTALRLADGARVAVPAHLPNPPGQGRLDAENGKTSYVWTDGADIAAGNDTQQILWTIDGDVKGDGDGSGVVPAFNEQTFTIATLDERTGKVLWQMRDPQDLAPCATHIQLWALNKHVIANCNPDHGGLPKVMVVFATP